MLFVCSLEGVGSGGAIVAGGGGDGNTQTATFKLPSGTYQAVGMYKSFSQAYGGGCTVVAGGQTRIDLNYENTGEQTTGIQRNEFTMTSEFTCTLTAYGANNTGMMCASCGIRKIG